MRPPILGRKRCGLDVPKPGPKFLGTFAEEPRATCANTQPGHEDCGSTSRTYYGACPEKQSIALFWNLRSRTTHEVRIAPRCFVAEELVSPDHTLASVDFFTWLGLYTCKFDACRRQSGIRAAQVLCVFVTRRKDDTRMAGVRAEAAARVKRRPPNGSHAKLCGQGPRAEAERGAPVAAIELKQRDANCNRRDAVMLAMR
jgi:hypothetical protein